MAKRLTLIGVLLLLGTFAASAGDIAQFVNLGFSADSKHFMFGQYGILEKSSCPWAETYIVEVASNSFAPRGTRKVAATVPVDPGASGLGALLNALAESLPQTKHFRIDHLLTGRLLYVLVDGEPASDALEFRDFPTGRAYTIRLEQSGGNGNGGDASFHLSIAIEEKGGKTRTLTAGDPSYKRPGVKAYHIKQIVLAPDNSSLIFLIQKEERDSRGSNIRYMVEAVRVK
jgi:predicted secreted protein